MLTDSLLKTARNANGEKELIRHEVIPEKGRRRRRRDGGWL